MNETFPIVHSSSPQGSRWRAALAATVVALTAVLFCLLNSLSAGEAEVRDPAEALRQGLLASAPIYLVPLGLALATRGGAGAWLKAAFAWPRGWGFGPCLGALGFLFAGEVALGSVISPVEEQAAMELLAQCSVSTLFCVAVPLCVAVPVVEELLFRGLLQGVGRGAWTLFLSAGLFALAHGVNAFLLPLFWTGLVLGVMARRSGSLLPGILLHALFNAVNLFAVLL